MPTDKAPCVVLLPLTLQEVTLLSLQFPGIGWDGIIKRADAVRVNYLKSIKAKQITILNPILAEQTAAGLKEDQNQEG